MRIDWGVMLAVFLAIVAASLVEHLVIAPHMAHSPARAMPGLPRAEATASEYVRAKYPNATTI